MQTFLRRGKRTIQIVRRYYPLSSAIDRVARSGKYLEMQNIKNQAKSINKLEELARLLEN